MSMFKYFAPPEWDDDVPKDSLGENLTKKHKLRKGKSKKEKSEDKPNDKINGNGNGNDHPVNKKNKKRKNETYELVSKKKKRENVESYIKFESPKFDGSFEKNIDINNTTPTTPMSKNSWKKKQRKLNNSTESGSKALLTNVKKNKAVPNLTQNNKKSFDTVLDNSTNSTNVDEVSWKTLKNRKRRAKKNKNKDVENSINSEVAEKTSSQKQKKNSNDITNISKDSNSIETSSKTNETLVEKNKKEKKNKNHISLISKKSSKINHSDRKSLQKKNKLKDVLKNTPILLQNEDNTDDIKIKAENSEILANMNSEKESKKSDPPKSLRERMLERLKGARFRFINEQIYKRESNEANKLFKEDPDAFQAYHEGYRQQINKWPLNPLDVIITDISKLSKNYIIADLGCGDARLAQSVTQKVHSFDLVSLNPNVTACDMSHTPLLTANVDVAVFCLSLMGTNLKDYIIEANRILKIGGLLKIAEVESRFENIDQFTSDVQKYGFSLMKKDLNNDLFYFIDFKKVSDIQKRNKVPQLNLNPCYYKKR